MTYISLFSGIGGLDLAVESVIGQRPTVFVENNKFARQILEKNMRGVILQDVRDIDFKEFRGVDGIVGGWPCQPHSLAGKRLGSKDDRDMWPHFARAIREAKPRWILGENVKGVLSSEKGEYFGRILGDLAEMGYSAVWRTILASDVGAPHRRERFFIYAVANSYVGRGEQYSQEERVIPIASQNDVQLITNTEDSIGRIGVGGFSKSERLGWGRYPGQDTFDWQQYAGAIRRWENIVGPHPYPVDEKSRLTPNFIEWIMGFPKGWTDGLSRNQSLRGLGNAVVPLQGAVAFNSLRAIIRTLNL